MASAGFNGLSSATALPEQNQITNMLLGSLAKGDANVGSRLNGENPAALPK